jgi:hypothetical protein
MKKSQRRKNDDRIPFMPTPPRQGQCYEALKPLDKVAAEMESKWGVEQLTSLVSPDMAMRFERARQQLDDAVAADDPELTAQKAAALIRGWRKLDEEATAAGHPVEPDKVWHCEQDGFAIAVVQNHAHGKYAAEGHRVFTIDEVTRLIASRFKDIYDVKAVFPDSEVVRVTETGEGKTPMNWETGDEIPF